ncbi:competence/damage-inducible protein A [bacterium]|nr:competence/damage-inducible protein A [bacterium]
MFVELITTGSELLLGATLNSHQQWIGRRLAEIGLPVNRQLTVPDTGTAIADAVREALTRADLVITTGGLGPTSDDRTRDEIARLLNLSLTEDPEVLKQIELVFKRRNRPFPPNFETIARTQAQVPAGAIVLKNEHGSAPGLAIDVATENKTGRGRLLIVLPGPPRELHPMFLAYAIPLLKTRFPEVGTFSCLTFHTIGVGESRVEDAIRPHLVELESNGLEIGYCARVGEVDVRLTALGPKGEELVREASLRVRRLLGKFIYSESGQSLEEVIVHLLAELKQTLVTAESCTGGFVSHCLTNVPGASDVLLGGLVTYSNEFKRELLGVRDETLSAHGAVSEQTAREMAEGARTRYRADYAIAITGIAGPGGGSVEKPVGTVFIGVADANGVDVQRHQNAFDRETFKFITGRQSLEMLRRRLITAQREK